MTKRQTALANINELACIGVQAIEAQKARRVWLDARALNSRLLRAYSSETGEAFIGGAEEVTADPEIDAAYAERRRAGKESSKQARKLRSMVNRYQAGLKS
jgi:hypothetical protein